MNSGLYLAISSLWYALAGLPVLLIVRVLWNRRNRVKKVKTTVLHETLIVLLGFFILFFVCISILPRFEVGPSGTLGIMDLGRGTVNLIPFYFLYDAFVAGNRFVLFAAIGNLAWFSAIGLISSLLWTVSIAKWKLLLCCAGGIVLCEAIGYVQGRAFDLDSILLRTLGFAVGWLVCRWIGLRSNRIPQRCKMIKQTASS